ncbi:MAG: sulfurtransferase TusA family protein [Proteobacteria bacterium]|nr:sulfurtransferase TusA family protein [Pseudomonadota bacterium]
MDQAPPLLVDARGHRCPVPTLRLRRALEGLATGGRVRLFADDPMAKIDVPHFCNEIGYLLLESKTEGESFSFLVEKP